MRVGTWNASPRSAEVQMHAFAAGPYLNRHGPEPITVDRSIGGDRPLILPPNLIEHCAR